jgi:hypothetical protein
MLQACLRIGESTAHNLPGVDSDAYLFLQRFAIAVMLLLLPAASFWGVDTVWLHVHKKNQGARMLYESMGFTPATTKGLPTVMSLLGEVLLVRPVQQHSCSMPGSKAVAISEGVLQESSIAKQEPAGCSGSGSYQWGLKELQQDEPT